LDFESRIRSQNVVPSNQIIIHVLDASWHTRADDSWHTIVDVGGKSLTH